MKIKKTLIAGRYIALHPIKSWRIFTPKTRRRIKKIVAVILIVCLSVPGYLWYEKNYGGEVPEAEAAWWNDSWMYRKSITVSNSSGGILTDFQVKILDNKDLSTDITAGKIQADLDDLRFTDINGTVLPYWIEDSTTNSVDVWVKMSNIPTTGATVYFYYGNAQATSEQNGNNVFEFFDDFNDGDVSDWSKESSTIASGTVDGAVGINITPGGANYKDVEVYKTTTLPSSYTVETRVKDIGGGEYPGGLLIAFQDVNNWIGLEGSAAQWTERGENGGSDTGWIHTYTPNIIPTGWSNQRIDIPNDGNYKVWINGTFQATKALPYSFTRNGVGFCKHISYNNIFSDWIFVRKYASTDPTAGTPATEEKGGAPVASWSFDEGTGTTTYDSSSNRNNGTLTNMASSADPNSGWQSEDKCVSGKCLAFDGTDDYVAKNSFPALTAPVTISFWYNRKSSSGYGRIFQFSNYIELADYSGGFAYTYKKSDGNWHNWTHSGVGFDNSKWNFYTFYFDGRYVKIYKNGNLSYTYDEGSDVGLLGSVQNLSIGAGGTNERINGSLDEIKIYSYARTPAQIAKDYNAGLSGIGKSSEGTSASIGGKSNKWLTDGLVGHWKVDEGTGTSTRDSSGNNKNSYSFNAGNESGAPTWSSGKYGNALTFSNVSGQVGNSVSINNGVVDMSANNSFSFFSWVYLTGNTTMSRIFTNGYGCTKNISFHVTDGGGPMRVQITDSNDVWSYFSSGYTVPLNQWKHIGFSFTKNGKIDFFVDGVRINSQDFTVSTFKAVTGNSIIGACTCSYNDGTNGKLDEVRIYNRALSPKEVSDLYNYAPGPVGYWNMDDATGTTAKDLSGNNNHGTLTNGPTWTTQGKYGGATSFDGSDDYVLGSTTDYRNTDYQGTISGWVKSANPNSWQVIFSSGDYASSNRYMELFFRSDGKIGFAQWNADGVNDTHIYGNTALSANTWYYVSVTSDGSAYKMFINGTEQSLTVQTGSNNGDWFADTSARDDWTMGAIKWNNGVANYMNGLIDDVRVYNYARTQKQIVEDMNGGHSAGGSPVGSQVGYWKFDEGNGTTANNSGNGGSALNGTLTNGPTWTNDGKLGKALSFLNPSGQVGQYVSTACPVFPLSSGDAITASFWVNPNSSQLSSNDPLLLFSQTFAVDIGKTAPFRIGFRPKSGGNTVAVSLSNALPANTFTHVTIVFTQNSNVKFYINGILKQTSSFPYITDVCSSNFFIGGYSQAWNGSQSIIDELKIYNYALTESEIQLDYNQGKSMVLGSKGTESDGRTPSNSASRAYCPPGNVEGNCAPGLNPSPVGEWSLDDGSGTTAKDKSGNGLNGTVTGASWITGGKSGNALNFNGSSNYVTVDDNSILKPTTAISVGAWFNTRDKTAGQRIISKTDSSGYQISLNPLVEAACPAGTLCFQLNLGGSYYGASYAVSNLSNDTWYYVSGVYNGSTVKLYLNGREIASNNASGSITQGAIPVCVGSEPASTCTNGGGYYFNGLIDEVKIYNYARTPAQVAWDYNRGAPVGWWRMDEGQGTSARDYSGNGNHGTLTNMDPATDWVTGKNNGALDFDGSNDYVSISNVSSYFSGKSEVSVSFWVYNRGNPLRSIMNLVGGQIFSIENINGGSSPAYVYFNNNNPVGIILPLNGWTHVTTTFQNGTVKGYKDGALADTKTNTSSTLGTISANLNLGYSNWTSTYANLILDDVRIYNYALSAEQVKQIYNNGAVEFK